VQAETERIRGDTSKVRLRTQVKNFRGDWPQRNLGDNYQQAGIERAGYEVDVAVGSPDGAPPMIASSDAPTGAVARPLWQMLIYALLWRAYLERDALCAPGDRAENTRVRDARRPTIRAECGPSGSFTRWGCWFRFWPWLPW